MFQNPLLGLPLNGSAPATLRQPVLASHLYFGKSPRLYDPRLPFLYTLRRCLTLHRSAGRRLRPWPTTAWFRGSAPVGPHRIPEPQIEPQIPPRSHIRFL